jgi:hypothetical protein
MGPRRASKHLQKTLTRVGGSGDGLTRVALPEMGDAGLLHGVQARCSTAAGGESATVLLGRNGPLATPPVEGDLTYESAATAYNASASNADLRDTLPFPYAFYAPGRVMDLAMLVTGMGAADFTLVVDLDFEVEP